MLAPMQAMEAMLRKRKQALLTQRQLDANNKPSKQPGGLAKLWGFVSGAASDSPEQSLALIELEVRPCSAQGSMLMRRPSPAVCLMLRQLDVNCKPSVWVALSLA